MFDKVIHGRFLKDGHLQESYICINGGRIEKIARNRPSNGNIGELHSYGKRLVLPGVIDSHVHMRDPGLTGKEDLYTGSVSAAFGGATSFIDMPNTIPPTMGHDELLQKYKTASEKAVVDHGFNLCITSDSNPHDAARSFDMDSRPVALKAFMGESTGKLVFGPFGDLSRWGKLLSESSLPLCIHAEDGSKFVNKELSKKDILSSHNEKRPPISEASAILRSLEALKGSSQHLHILHVSTEESIKAASGKDCTLEVTPHHLLLDVKMLEKRLDHQGFAKVNPPIRNTSDRAALLKGIKDGNVLTMGSDHAPHRMEEKMDDFPPPSGMPGVETMLPLMLDQVRRRILGLDKVLDLLCRNPATRFNIVNRGSIEPGKIADLVIIDMDGGRKIRGEELHSKCGWTVYEEMNGIFPEAVFSRGDMIIENDVLCASPGRGKRLL